MNQSEVSALPVSFIINVNRVLEFRGMFRVLQFAQKCMAWNIVKNEGFDTFISKFSDIKHD